MNLGLPPLRIVHTLSNKNKAIFLHISSRELFLLIMPGIEISDSNEFPFSSFNSQHFAIQSDSLSKDTILSFNFKPSAIPVPPPR